MTMYPSRDDIAAASRILGTSNPSARMLRNVAGSWTVILSTEEADYHTVEERLGAWGTYFYCDCSAWNPVLPCAHVGFVAASLHR